jgi:predicted short-subunit dehydrogenase-like oxidoreductase (DUF2520 family)
LPRALSLPLAVPDSELAGLVSGLAATSAVRPERSWRITSGANGVNIWRRWPRTAAYRWRFTGDDVHRLDEDISRLPDTCFDHRRRRRRASDRAVAGARDGRGCPVCARTLVLYHAALAHAGNHIVARRRCALRVKNAARQRTARQQLSTISRGHRRIDHRPLARAALQNTLQRDRPR